MKAIETIMTTDTQGSPTTEHYYGTITDISYGNDVSMLTRGSVWYLKDQYQKYDDCKSMHPYIVISATFLDKIGKITVAPITSCPIYINMIPIMIENSITYINPYQTYTFKVTAFQDSNNSAYIGTCTNQTVLDLLGNMHGMWLGLNLSKSNAEIIDDYLKYVDEFESRNKHVSRYVHKKLPTSEESKNIQLTISFDIFKNQMNEVKIPNDILVDSIESEAKDEPTKENEITDTVTDKVEEQKTVTVETHKAPKTSKSKDKIDEHEARIQKALKLYRGGEYTLKQIHEKTGVSSTTIYNRLDKSFREKSKNRKEIVIDKNDLTVLSEIARMESLPAGEVKFDKPCSKMSELEIKVLFLYSHLHGDGMTGMLYNCSASNIEYRKTKISTKYNVIIE